MKKLFWLTVVCSVLVGCFYRELEDAVIPAWSPTVALSLVSSEFKAGDLLGAPGPEGYIYIDDDNGIGLAYHTTLLSTRATEIFEIPDFSFDISGPFDQLSLPLEFEEGDILGRLSIANGIFSYAIAWADPQEGELMMSFPQWKRFGDIVSHKIATQASQQLYSGTIDLSGVTMDFSGLTNENVLDILFAAFDEHGPVDFTLDRFTAELSDLVFSEIEGQLRSFKLDHRVDTFDLGVVHNWVKGSVVFVNPRISIVAESSFGIPLVLSVDNFSGLGSGGATELSGDVLNRDWVVQEAMAGSQVRDSVVAVPGNSNVVDFLSISPSRISYRINLSANVSGGGVVRLSDRDHMTVTAGLQIPLHCMIRDAVLMDTFDVDIPEVTQLRRMELILWFENSFPHAIGTQVFLLDSLGHTLDSLFQADDLLMTSAQTDVSGHVVSVSSRKTVVKFEAETIARLYRTRKLVIRARISTSADGNQPVRYSTENSLRCRISANATLAP